MRRCLIIPRSSLQLKKGKSSWKVFFHPFRVTATRSAVVAIVNKPHRRMVNPSLIPQISSVKMWLLDIPFNRTTFRVCKYHICGYIRFVLGFYSTTLNSEKLNFFYVRACMRAYLCILLSFFLTCFCLSRLILQRFVSLIVSSIFPFHCSYIPEGFSVVCTLTSAICG